MKHPPWIPPRAGLAFSKVMAMGLRMTTWGFPARHGATPSSLDGLFQGKSEKNMDDDWGYPYDSGNLYLMVDEWMGLANDDFMG